MQLTEFVERYAPNSPAIAAANQDQLRLLTSEDGVVDLRSRLEPRAGQPGTPEGRHLWVVLPVAIPVILETAPDVRPPPLESGVAKHTNLTGGGPACCGGELWTDAVDSTHLFVNGGSGRYPPSTPAQLADAVRVIEHLGYRVTSAGWDDDNDRPARTFR